MGVLENIKQDAAARSNNAGRGRGAAQQDLPKAQLWLNIGYETADGKFVNLPTGIPVDTTEPLRVSGQNEDWIALTKARNALLEALQAKGFALEPGAAEVLNLKVQIRRVSAETDVAVEDNPYAVDLSTVI